MQNVHISRILYGCQLVVYNFISLFSSYAIWIHRRWWWQDRHHWLNLFPSTFSPSKTQAVCLKNYFSRALHNCTSLETKLIQNWEWRKDELLHHYSRVIYTQLIKKYRLCFSFEAFQQHILHDLTWKCHSLHFDYVIFFVSKGDFFSIRRSFHWHSIQFPYNP